MGWIAFRGNQSRRALAVALSLLAWGCAPARIAAPPPAAAPPPPALRCDSPGLRAELDPELADYRCTTSETTEVVDGRRLRSRQVSPDNCSTAEVQLVITNCTDERLVVSRARTSSNGVAGSVYELSDEAVVLPHAVWRYPILVGRVAGPITTDVELLAPDGSVRAIRAPGRVRGVMTHYVN